MTYEDRIAVFEKVGKSLAAIDGADFDALAFKVRNENPWFIPANVRMAIDGIVKMLSPEDLHRWAEAYDVVEVAHPKRVGVVMAGNIPLVGFHDLFCVLVSGHVAVIKPSSKDQVLTLFMIDLILKTEPRFAEYIVLAQQLKDIDAVIATGSDNSSRYFEYYFGKYPHIIRKNRTSCAVLSGFEQPEDLQLLGKDVFSYFGLGCRNVSKLYVPKGYEFPLLLDQWSSYGDVIMHHKYTNNYDYQKSILLVNREPFLDNGFVLLQESEKLVSPISVLYYEYYEHYEDLTRKAEVNHDKIQCIIGKMKPATILFGQAQMPGLKDYADNVDTMQFLLSLTN